MGLHTGLQRAQAGGEQSGGNRSVCLQPETGTWGVWEWKEGDGSMGISVLMPGLIISLVERFSPIEVFQPNSTLGVVLTTIRRVEVY